MLTGLFLTGLCAVILIAAFVMFGAGDRVKKTYNVILVSKTIDDSNSFWTSLIAGAKLGAEDFNINLKVVGGVTEVDIEGQIKRIRESIKEKPDVMLVAPCSYTKTTKALQEVVDSGIKLILIDSVVDKDVAKSTVATDNYAAGEQLGRYAKTLVNQDTQIGIVAHVKGASTAIEREKGLRDGLGKFQSQVVDVVYCGSSYNKAYDLTKSMLKTYPDMGMIMGTNEYSAVGAARAIKDLGLAGKVKVVGFDNSVEEIQLMEEGVFQGIIIQKPFNMGYLGIEQALDIMTGKKVEKNLDSGCKLITRKNMYEEENQRLLYPFTGQQ